MARILAKGLFDDDTKVDYVRQDPAARVPNVTTGKVDIVIQFMTISSSRAQLVAFSRPYYIEGSGMMVTPKSKYKTLKELVAAGAAVNAAILANVYADDLVHRLLPQAQVLQLDSQANVFQAITAGRADVALVDASTVKWLVKRNPDIYANPIEGDMAGQAQLYGAAVRQGDPDWLQWVNTCFDVAMYGHEDGIYDKAYEEFFGEKRPPRVTGFPPM